MTNKKAKVFLRRNSRRAERKSSDDKEAVRMCHVPECKGNKNVRVIASAQAIDDPTKITSRATR